jgi:hypothetical protein
VWLLAAVAGASVVIGVAALLLGSRGDTDPVAEVRSVAAPVGIYDAQLATRLDSIDDRTDYPSAAQAASALASRARTAESQLDSGTDLDGLRTALAAQADYATVLASALRSPSQTAFARAQEARSSAQQAVAVLDPETARAAGLTVPSFGPVVAAEQQHARQLSAKAKARSIARAYVGQLDRLLRNSAESRGDLGTLINGIMNGSIPAYQARDQIAAILAQRQNLENAVAQVMPPARFQQAHDLLRTSIAASIDDDQAISGWISAWYVDDVVTFNRYWSEHLAATERATSAKQAFVTAYTTARTGLGVGAYTIGSDY